MPCRRTQIKRIEPIVADNISENPPNQRSIKVKEAVINGKCLFGWLGVAGCIILVGLVLAPAPAMAQTTWSHAYGGADNDVAFSIQQTGDGGYIVAGVTGSFGAGSDDIWVLKLDSSGNVTWQRTYGGASFDEANSIQQTGDGGYIVAGMTDSFGAGDADFWVLKLDGNGEMDPSCAFISDTSVSPFDSGVAVTNTGAANPSTSATITNTVVTGVASSGTDTLLCFGGEICDNGIDDDRDGLVDCDDPDCDCPDDCTDTNYSRGTSSIAFIKDRKSLKMCVNSAFCDALRADPEEIVLEVDGCDPLTVPAERLKSNRSKTRFFARSVRGERPRFTLIIDCEEGWLKLRLRNADLKDCVSNPVKTCVSITNGPCLCAEDEFVENRDSKGRLRKLFLRVREACLPTVDSNQ